MSVGGMDYVAHPGSAAPTAERPGEPKTRENNNNTERHPLTRRLVLGGLGVVGLSALGYLAWPKGGGNAVTQPHTTETAKGNEQKEPRGDFAIVPRVFFGPNGEPLELRRDQITLPETLDPKTYEEAFAAMGQAIQYYVNNNNMPGIHRIVPGTYDGHAMSPGQFDERAAFFERYRQVFGDEWSESQHADDPENKASNYAWGLQVRLLELGSGAAADIDNAHYVTGRVHVAMGDYRPTLDGTNYAEWHIEQPRAFEGTMTLTRWKSAATGQGWPDGGWSVYNMVMYEIPERIAKNPPAGYEKTPPLYPGGIR